MKTSKNDIIETNTFFNTYFETMQMAGWRGGYTDAVTHIRETHKIRF
jgi:hypothetical protein